MFESSVLAPPFTRESAIQKVRISENAWNERNPEKIILGYTKDCTWRGRSKFLQGREAVEDYLRQKWNSEQDYRVIKELWTFGDNRIAIRFQYEWHNNSGLWFRSCGAELWEFNEEGFICKREASVNDLIISEEERRFLWPLGSRPEDHPGLLGLGL
ncbi:nuclear transport factor 2 family protein [Entomobacter blattae]|uniref:DUF1348 domain-containing protein n=1 Tax=Entomobacter blattae TaxID=2762277 RepID=A0A7H1NNU4_9PROT|nr:nuclear transport factor 2 family protein [Entomobacter blattae]QNT77454.1 hypothetical protein JGUZn3_01950 [Entomobacter blattae]